MHLRVTGQDRPTYYTPSASRTTIDGDARYLRLYDHGLEILLTPEEVARIMRTYAYDAFYLDRTLQMPPPRPVETDSSVGWVIIHPDGRYELDYFSVRNFRTKADGYTEPITPEAWRDDYRPGCQIVRMRVVPLSGQEPVESPTSGEETTPV